MKTTKAQRSVTFCLLALAACSARVDGNEEVASTEDPLIVVQPPIRPKPLRLCTVPSISEYDVPTPGGAPSSIVTGPDGNLWFVESGTNKIGAFSPTSSTFVTETSVTRGSGPWQIAVGSDGNLWFTETLGNRIGQMSTAGTLLQEFGMPSTWASGYEDPNYIAPGPNGNLWFTGSGFGQITTGGVVTPVSTGTTPFPYYGTRGIVTGPDQNLWITQSAGNPAVGTLLQVTPSGQITPFSLPVPSANKGNGALPSGLTVGPDGNLWIIGGNTVWQANTAGQVLGTFGLSGSNLDDAEGIATGSDGNLWFTDYSANQVGRMTTSGATTTWTLGGGSNAVGPSAITPGPDGALWFTEKTANKIGRITPSICHYVQE